MDCLVAAARFLAASWATSIEPYPRFAEPWALTWLDEVRRSDVPPERFTSESRDSPKIASAMRTRMMMGTSNGTSRRCADSERTAFDGTSDYALPGSRRWGFEEGATGARGTAFGVRPLGQLLYRQQSAVPTCGHFGQRAGCFGEPLGAYLVVDLAALAVPVNQSHSLQEHEVFGNCLTTDGHVRAKRGRRGATASNEQIEQLAAGGIRHCLPEFVVVRWWEHHDVSK